MQQLVVDGPAPNEAKPEFTPGILDKVERLNNMRKLISIWKGVGN
jgi:hypothetical protein